MLLDNGPGNDDNKDGDDNHDDDNDDHVRGLERSKTLKHNARRVFCSHAILFHVVDVI